MQPMVAYHTHTNFRILKGSEQIIQRLRRERVGEEERPESPVLVVEAGYGNPAEYPPRAIN